MSQITIVKINGDCNLMKEALNNFDEKIVSIKFYNLDFLNVLKKKLILSESGKLLKILNEENNIYKNIQVKNISHLHILN